MRISSFIVLPLLLVLAACDGKSDSTTTSPAGTPTTGSGTGTSTGTGTGTGASTGTGTGTGASTGTGTGSTTTGTVPLTVTDDAYNCTGSTGTLTNDVRAQVAGGGTIHVIHDAFEWGCCPDFGVVARADHGTDTIEVNYQLQPDYCDCICALGATYTISGIPAGSWTLSAYGATTQVVMP